MGKGIFFTLGAGHFRTLTVGSVLLFALVACSEPGTSTSTKVSSFGLSVAPPEVLETATQRIRLSPLKPHYSDPIVACVPGPNAKARAERTRKHFEEVATPWLLNTSVKGPALDAQYAAKLREPLKSNQCHMLRSSTFLPLESVSRKVTQGDLMLHAFKKVGDLGSPTGFAADCARLEGQTVADARANAERALSEYIARWDKQETDFEKRVQREGSAAFKNSNQLEKSTALRDDIRQKYRCISVRTVHS
ncbi:hypothetical protein [Algirhabdus cladophorae]|uniref:hypothetical protein n=1 Tax=Algirhabdus cladophorae TaxID=3377108 RepID=UPI003B84B700